jgi:hypothetical protein
MGINIKGQKNWRLLDRQFRNVMSDTEQTPLCFHLVYPPKSKSAEPPILFDPPKHGFHHPPRPFAPIPHGLPAVPASYALPPFGLSSPSITPPRSSACAHSPIQASIRPVPPTSHAPASAQNQYSAYAADRWRLHCFPIQLMVAWLPASLRCQPSRSFPPLGSQQAFYMPLTHSKLFCRRFLPQPLFIQPLHHFHPTQFLFAHRYQIHFYVSLEGDILTRAQRGYYL